MLWEILLKWAVPFFLGGAAAWVASLWRVHSRRDRALCDGVECLLRAEIIDCHERYGGMGFCPLYAKESLKRVYGAYHELGGNDVATSLYEKTMALPERARRKNHDGEREDKR